MPGTSSEHDRDDHRADHVRGGRRDLDPSALSFLGFGLRAGADWGEMLSSGTTYLYDGYWWLIYPAGLAILLTVLAFNFIGDALRDALEVRLQHRSEVGMVAPLLDVSDLRTDIQQQPARCTPSTASRSRRAGRDPRLGRRVRLRQDHDRAVDHAAAADRRAHRRRQHPARGRDLTTLRRGRCAGSGATRSG